MKGVTIGEGAVIGCNSVVMSDIPPFALALGNPARILVQDFGRPSTAQEKSQPPATHEQPEAKTLTRVQEVFQEAFGIEPQLISLETNPSDVRAWDSFGHMDLASRLERAFGISLDVDDLMEMENVREIIRIVSSKL